MIFSASSVANIGVEVVDSISVIRNFLVDVMTKVVSAWTAELNAAMLQAKPSACHQTPGLLPPLGCNRRGDWEARSAVSDDVKVEIPEVFEQAAGEHHGLFRFFYPVLE